jgi:hypothetical protein
VRTTKPKKLQSFQHFSVSKSQLFSKASPHFGHDRGKDADEFVGFLVKKLGPLTVHATVFHQQFEPQLGFIGLLKQPIELRAKLCVRPSPRRFSACEIVFASVADVSLPVGGLEIFFSSEGVGPVQRGLIVDQLERAALFRRGHPSRFVLRKTLSKVASATGVEAAIKLGHENVYVVHTFISQAKCERQPRFQSAKAVSQASVPPCLAKADL